MSKASEENIKSAQKSGEEAHSPHFRYQNLLRAYLKENGFKQSRQRDIVASIFFEQGDNEHLTVDDLLRAARDRDAQISQATIYRAVKVLVDAGVVEARHFVGGQTRYELADDGDEHHDHLICTKCDRIVEFVNDEIEELQERVAREHGFIVADHKMELYGICANCRTST